LNGKRFRFARAFYQDDRMEKRNLRILILCFAAAFVSGCQAIAPEQLAVQTANLSSSPAPLKGFLFKPEGNGRHPAVIMMHGCGGAYASSGKLGDRHRMWGEYLAAHGYVVLLLDSFSSRGIVQLCTTRFAERPLKESDRVGDAYAALAYLRERADVDTKRVALLGWSHGAGVTLDAITHKPEEGVGFSAAVAFYPGCSARNKRADRFHPYAPLLVLIGEADDWTPALPCKQLTAAVAARGEAMRIVTYPGTYHDFDNPAVMSKHVRTEVPNGVNPRLGVTVAPNPEAREDAKKRVLAFLAKTLQ
jgi:dienelactone hydrolase